MGSIKFFSDGGCRVKNNVKGNKVGEDDVCAYAYRIDEDDIIHARQGKAFTGFTNNQMELAGFIAGLEHMVRLGLNDEHIVCYLDSKYVLDGISSWLPNWKKNNWRTSQKKPVKNKDFWVKIDQNLVLFSNIEYIWVKGHENNDGNNDVDQLLNYYMDEKEKELSIIQPNKIVDDKTKTVTKMDHEDFMEHVTYAIANEESDLMGHHIDPEKIFCVWSCKTLQNSKAIFSAPYKEALMWEATMNGDTGEIYLDGYKKKVHLNIKFG